MCSHALKTSCHFKQGWSDFTLLSTRHVHADDRCYACYVLSERMVTEKLIFLLCQILYVVLLDLIQKDFGF